MQRHGLYHLFGNAGFFQRHQCIHRGIAGAAPLFEHLGDRAAAELARAQFADILQAHRQLVRTLVALGQLAAVPIDDIEDLALGQRVNRFARGRRAALCHQRQSERQRQGYCA